MKNAKIVKHKNRETTRKNIQHEKPNRSKHTLTHPQAHLDHGTANWPLQADWNGDWQPALRRRLHRTHLGPVGHELAGLRQQEPVILLGLPGGQVEPEGPEVAVADQDLVAGADADHGDLRRKLGRKL